MLVRDSFGNMHTVNNNYDNKDLIVPSTQTKTFNEMTPTDLLTRSAYNMNRASTKVNEARAVTLQINGPTHRGDFGGRIGSKRKTNW